MTSWAEANGWGAQMMGIVPGAEDKGLPPRLGRVLVLLAASSLLAGCSHESESVCKDRLPTATVHVQTVESRKRPLIEEVVATVAFKLRATVEAKVSGRIEKMLVTEGQAVGVGELLAELDVKEIEARLEQAKATMEEAELDLKRSSTLVRERAVSQSAFEAAQTRQRVARAAVREAETMLGYAKVVAPFEGVVTRKLADVGDLAGPGKPLLEVADPKALRLEADIPESLIGRLEAGGKLPVRFDSPELTMEGVTSEIAPVADPNSRTFLVKMDLPFEPRLRAGMFGRLWVPVGERSALRLPAASVVRRGQLEIVYVVEDQLARLRLVKTGKRWGEEVEIVSGLEGGERVVTEGPGNLLDGQPVEAQP